MSKKQEETAMTTPDPVGTEMQMFDYGEDEGAGYERITKDDTSIPFLSLVQGLSPVMKDDSLSAKLGMWFNSGSRKLYPKDKGVVVVPSTTRHYFAKYTPRKEGGGFHGHELPESPIVQKAMKESTKFGQYFMQSTEDSSQTWVLTEYYYIYGVTCDEETLEPDEAVCIGIKSTHIKPYRAWMSRLLNVKSRRPDGTYSRPPMYGHLVRLTSYEDSNAEGDFYVPVFGQADHRGMKYSLVGPGDSRFQAAKQLKLLIDSGDREANYAKATETDGEAASPF